MAMIDERKGPDPVVADRWTPGRVLHEIITGVDDVWAELNDAERAEWEQDAAAFEARTHPQP